MKKLLLPAYRSIKKLGREIAALDVRLSEEKHRREFMRRAFHALGFNGISGDYAEFGSHGATTFALAHAEIRRWPQTRMMWAFNSFSGLPEQKGPKDFHPGWKKGKMTTSVDSFHAACRSRGIDRSSYRTVEGFYEKTLARPDDPDLPVNIALAFVDCDLYSSTMAVLKFLDGRLKHGMIIAFDDYFCFSDRTLSGERMACLEVFNDDHRYYLLPYIQFGWHGMSFILEDRQLLGGAGPERL